MGWTWHEYQSQPAWFVEMLYGLLAAESEKQARDMKHLNGSGR